MVMPFPGMDPYLEHPVLWPGVHGQTLVWMMHQLRPRLHPRYIISLEERVVVEGPDEQRAPDLWIQRRRPAAGEAAPATTPERGPLIVEVEEWESKQRYLEILDRYQKLRVVTVIELVSPSNKARGAGRRAYRKKQKEVRASGCHLVEIDLLRTGRHVLAVPEVRVKDIAEYDYLVCVSRWPNRRRFELYPWRLREPIPIVRIPLADSDPDVPLDLRAALEQTYQDGSYALRVRYEEPCVPALTAADQEWAHQCWAVFRASQPDLFPPVPPAGPVGPPP